MLNIVYDIWINLTGDEEEEDDDDEEEDEDDEDEDDDEFLLYLRVPRSYGLFLRSLLYPDVDSADDAAVIDAPVWFSETRILSVWRRMPLNDWINNIFLKKHTHC